MQKKKGQYSFSKCKILRPSISTHIQEKLMSFPYLLKINGNYNHINEKNH